MSRLPAIVQTTFAQFNRTKLCCACYFTPNPNIKYIQSRNAVTRVDVSKSKLIYHGNLENKIWWLKVFSWNSTGLFYVAAPVMFHYYELSSALLTSSMMIGVFTTTSPLIAHMLFKKYSIDLYYNEEKDVYTVTHYSLFGRKKYMEFTIADVERLGIEVFSTVKIKNRSLFFDPLGFSNIEHYKRMLGYDKPIEITPKKDDLEIEFKELREIREEREDATTSKESKIVESVHIEKNTQKIQQRV